LLHHKSGRSKITCYHEECNLLTNRIVKPLIA
jgi:hypothetical protein